MVVRWLGAGYEENVRRLLEATAIRHLGNSEVTVEQRWGKDEVAIR